LRNRPGVEDFEDAGIEERLKMSEFDRLMNAIEREAGAEGPEALEQLRSFDSRFHVAGQLLALRRRRGITQRELSELSGVQQADISRIERGETQPTTVTARRLADALGADFGFYEIDTSGKAVPVEPVSVEAA
jgi:DNA-binding XRE family transcriptional regulator